MAIISVQSHVTYGHVGNAAAVFPLQRMGFTVWPVHTVQFSNHTGYGTWEGEVFSARTIRKLLDGMDRRGAFDNCEGVLSGYMGAAPTASAILHAVELAREKSPQAMYCCDPVIGDTGLGIYVQEDIPAYFMDYAIPKADIITPNGFELGYLTGMAITTTADAIAAARKLMALGPSVVVGTSLQLSDTPDGFFDMLAVDANGCWRVQTPAFSFAQPVSGTGDAFAAMFFGTFLKTRNIETALSHTASVMHAIIERTHKTGQAEIALVDSQNDMINPPFLFRARRVNCTS